MLSVVSRSESNLIRCSIGQKMMCGLCDKHSEHCEHGEGVGGTDWERTTNLVKLCGNRYVFQYFMFNSPGISGYGKLE